MTAARPFVAYFNHINRVVDAVGVDDEPERGDAPSGRAAFGR